MKFVVVILIVLFSSINYAEEDTLTSSCNYLLIKEEQVKLSTEKPLLVIFHNLTNMDLWLTHTPSEPSASAGWNTRLQAGNWAALALDKETFALNCIESRPGHEQQVPCNGVISVCLWPATMPAKETGTYWAGENMTLPKLLTHLAERGFKEK